MAIGKIIEKNQIEIPDFIEKIVNDFCEFLQGNSIDLLNFKDVFRFVSENERRAVIVMCNISNLDKFFEKINNKYNLELECPPTHATLYTLKLDEGIFLTDANDIEDLTKIITNPELKL